jgi:aminoglycoside phosphotransferase (APT) family kinase protein
VDSVRSADTAAYPWCALRHGASRLCPTEGGSLRSMTGIDWEAAALRTGFTPENTAVTLRLACEAVGLEAKGAYLMRLGSNAVYRLAAPIVARIAPGAGAKEACKAVAVARWLASADYPAVRALDVEQPTVVDGRVVTFWEAVSDDGDTYASTSEVAEVLVKLHALEAPAELGLQPTRPFDRADERIEASSWLSQDDRAFLQARLVDLQARYADLSFVLPPGVIHGDANVGNVLHDQRGKPVVIDLDGFAVGPREWDLIQTAIFYDRFGWHTREEYQAFVSVYGFDIMEWAGYPVLRDAREFLMVTWLSQKADESERTAAEARKRISALRSGASRRDWLPY